MTMITLKYRLTDIARRAELAAGRDHSEHRSIALTPSVELAARADLNIEKTTIEHEYTIAGAYGRFEARADHVLVSETDALEWLASVDAASAAYEAQQQALRANEEEHASRNALASLERAEQDPSCLVKRRSDGSSYVGHDLIVTSMTTRERIDAVYALAEAIVVEREAERTKPIRAYVIACVPEYARAVREGRNVDRIGREHAIDAVRNAIAAACGERAITMWYANEDRDVPTDAAYAAQDELAAIVARVLADSPPELVALCGMPKVTIERVDVCPHKRESHSLTAAVVEVPVAGGHVDVALASEPVTSCTHEGAVEEA
jgi:hypothetical protein